MYHERVTAGTKKDPVPAADRITDAMSLIQLSQQVRDAFDRVAGRHDLTPLQGHLLCELAQAQRGMTELARVFGVERAALTGLVDRAERRGLVERRPVPGDRRAVSVALTAAGLRAATEFHEQVTIEVAQLLAPLVAGERAAFRAALATITRPPADPRSGSKHEPTAQAVH